MLREATKLPNSLLNALNKSIEMFPLKFQSGERRGRDIGKYLYHMSLIHKPGGSVIDLGGGVACSLLALSKLGMDVTVIDNYSRPYYAQDEYQEVLNIFRSSGIKIYEMDILDCSFDFVPDESIDHIVSFDCLEHLHHSPKKILEIAVTKLAPKGKLIIGSPNAVNVLKRIRVLFGRSNLCSLEEFYYQGNPFTGHIREWTKSELLQLASWLQLENAQVTGRNWFLHVKYAWLPRHFRTLIDVPLRIFPGLCSNLYLVAEKSESPIENRLKRLR